MAPVTYSFEFTSPIAPARFFKAGILHMHEIATQIMPGVIKSASVSGDGGVGTTKEYHFTEEYISNIGGAYKHVKDRTDALDKENFVCKYTIVEGGSLGTTYKAASHTLEFKPAANGGTVFKATAEVEALDGQEYPKEEESKAKEGMVGVYKAVEAYLLANPTAYA
ncbi:hypothetical protein Scep_008951 [Stephania cephalantha]|uniref:Bet v I/Major latex protein domain-containing protein n=1 Tax=Stephania cephalantha TaxID=152367 RepID=A0AAP0PFU7_9MAGN